MKESKLLVDWFPSFCIEDNFDFKIHFQSHPSWMYWELLSLWRMRPLSKPLYIASTRQWRGFVQQCSRYFFDLPCARYGGRMNLGHTRYGRSTYYCLFKEIFKQYTPQGVVAHSFAGEALSQILTLDFSCTVYDLPMSSITDILEWEKKSH